MVPKIPEEAKRFISTGDFKSAVGHEWTVEDWRDWCECIGFALWKIAKRNRLKKSPKELDYQI